MPTTLKLRGVPRLPGSYGERIQDVSRKFVPGSRFRVMGTYGKPTQIRGYLLYSDRAAADTAILAWEAEIGKEIILQSIDGTATETTYWTHNVQLLDVEPLTPKEVRDTYLGPAVKVDFLLTLQRLS